ncbi:response regulator [Paenibacillus xylaniclasticus]|uniref:response regulator n=1 Tax=Paenibacillus xylaniclasticus TaxID=588083 RepID=UPI000FD9E7E6|nr:MULTISPECIES: response regulator [Paenibacillus]GFN30088.1 AraC family transcriptional regulator [Paenibacillus curdlanolyticus]
MVYRLLVVDDEAFALKSVVDTIDWSSLQIAQVFAASDAEEARELLDEHAIDVMICDIEMPGENGLELLNWIRQRGVATETIFLTGHDRFDYAHTALQMGCFDYLLKPIRHERLKETVMRALSKLEDTRQKISMHNRVERYENLLRAQKHILVDRFWTDLIEPSGETYNTEPHTTYLSIIQPEFSANDVFMPVLFSVDRWKQSFGSRDEHILEYAMMNSARETVLRNWPGTVVKCRSGAIFIIIYEASNVEREMKELEWRCRRFIADCNQYFYGHVSCYIGSAGPIDRMASTCSELLDMERRNVSKSDSIFIKGEFYEDQQGMPPVTWPSELYVLFESGKKEELQRRIDELFSIYENQKSLSKEHLKAFYFHFVSMIYQTFHKSGISVDHSLESLTRQEDMAQATKSLSQLRAWTKRMTDAAMKAVEKRRNREPSVIELIEQYVQTHISQDLTREDIAAFLHFNPAYLSRLFKKETGLSLSDYIMDQRMKQAKRLLSESDLKVSDVAEITGYRNFSYFSKLFKKQEGFTPQEFRKRNKR